MVARRSVVAVLGALGLAACGAEEVPADGVGDAGAGGGASSTTSSTTRTLLTSSTSSTSSQGGAGGSGGSGGAGGAGGVVAIGAMHERTCAVAAEGTVRCWGGPATGAPQPVPTEIPGIAGATDVFVGPTAACAITPAGLACWGGDAAFDAAVASVPGAVAIAFGYQHQCVLDAAGAVLCWGENDVGQLGLGDGGPAYVGTPVAVAGLARATRVSANGFATCALLVDETVRCWGFNERGHLGDGTDVDRATPVAVVGLASVMRLEVGEQHSCAAVDDGSTWCWGFNNSGQLGPELATYQSFTPVEVPSPGAARGFALGVLHSCRVLDEAGVDCWGSNTGGELGRGDGATPYDDPQPVLIPGLEGALAVAAGVYHTCALRADRTVACWGSNARGELGDGTTDDRNAPVTVIW